MDHASVSEVTINDTVRTNMQQAEAMYNNVLRHGFDYQMHLYNPSGKAVLKAYQAAKKMGKDYNGIIAMMTDAVAAVRLASPGAFKHIGSIYFQSSTNTIDIGLSSIHPASSLHLLMGALNEYGAHNILEPQNHCLHVEIPQKSWQPNWVSIGIMP